MYHCYTLCIPYATVAKFLCINPQLGHPCAKRRTSQNCHHDVSWGHALLPEFGTSLARAKKVTKPPLICGNLRSPL
ncbi:hypothetical protein Y032_0190g1251 [Ancylostoma ceylanicum]|uniref:Uncharacterized protein n=1 Tax=Ancylostoma ceylanicum TaxID=53326 RepID=A0A016SR14_9BILA|nr:hypothetical protein Y032_0190g1251 [Ancylostoma ceylanicum]